MKWDIERSSLLVSSLASQIDVLRREDVLGLV